MKLDGKNKNLSKIRDWHNRTRSALFGGVGGGGGVILKIEVFVTYEFPPQRPALYAKVFYCFKK